jgi:hypothetical protein
MRFRHLKRGTNYIVFDLIQHKGPPVVEPQPYEFYRSQDGRTLIAHTQGSIFEGDIVVLYFAECAELDKYYARPATEFFDGRFERI